MGGFYGLFDYTKPGKGVKKNNGAEKKAFFQFVELFGRKFWDLIKLNLIFMLFALPVVTIGPALTARAYILREFVKEKSVFLWSDYKERFFKEFKQAFPLGLMQIFITGVIALNFYYLGFVLDLSQTMKTISFAVTGGVYILFCFAYYYIYTLLVTFELSFSALFKNSVIFAFQGFLRNLLAGLLKVIFVAALAAMFIFSFTLNHVFLFFFLLVIVTMAFSLDGFVEMFITYPLIKKYLIKEEEKIEEESVFSDTVE